MGDLGVAAERSEYPKASKLRLGAPLVPRELQTERLGPPYPQVAQRNQLELALPGTAAAAQQAAYRCTQIAAGEFIGGDLLAKELALPLRIGCFDSQFFQLSSQHQISAHTLILKIDGDVQHLYLPTAVTTAPAQAQHH